MFDFLNLGSNMSYISQFSRFQSGSYSMGHEFLHSATDKVLNIFPHENRTNKCTTHASFLPFFLLVFKRLGFDLSLVLG